MPTKTYQSDSINEEKLADAIDLLLDGNTVPDTAESTGVPNVILTHLRRALTVTDELEPGTSAQYTTNFIKGIWDTVNAEPTVELAEIAKGFDLPVKTVSYFVRIGHIIGYVAPRKVIDMGEEKRGGVIAAITDGATPNQVGELHEISPELVRHWLTKAGHGRLQKTQKIRKEVCDLVKQGFRNSHIVEKTRLPLTAIENHIRRGLELGLLQPEHKRSAPGGRTTPLTDEMRAEIARRLALRQSKKTIADALGVAPSTVTKIAGGIPLDQRPAAKAARIRAALFKEIEDRAIRILTSHETANLSTNNIVDQLNKEFEAKLKIQDTCVTCVHVSRYRKKVLEATEIDNGQKIGVIAKRMITQRMEQAKTKTVWTIEDSAEIVAQLKEKYAQSSQATEFQTGAETPIPNLPVTNKIISV